MGEPGRLAQNPGVLQGLPDTEALMRVEDDQLTDLDMDQRDITEFRLLVMKRLSSVKRLSKINPSHLRRVLIPFSLFSDLIKS